MYFMACSFITVANLKISGSVRIEHLTFQILDFRFFSLAQELCLNLGSDHEITSWLLRDLYYSTPCDSNDMLVVAILK